MHTSFRTELRYTQRVLGLIRPLGVNKSSGRVRYLSHGRPFRNENKPDKDAPNSGPRIYDASRSAVTPSSRFKPSELGFEIEKWINHLSKQGSSLQVWDTISERDESGRWKLSPQARKDLEDVDKWARENSSSTSASFGIKVADGRIRAVSTHDLRGEQETNFSTNIIHGPFISASETKESSENGQIQQHEVSAVTKSKENEIGVPIVESETGSDSHLSEPNATIVAGSTKFHGSAAARRQRAQRSKDRMSTYTLPTWFSNQNILPRGQSKSSVSSELVENQSTWQRGTREAIVLWQAQDTSMSSPTHGKTSIFEKSQNDTDAKEQSLSTGGNTGPSDDNIGQPDDDSTRPRASPIFVPLLNTEKAYYIEEAQHNELMASARGRLRSPASGSIDNRPGGIRGHLIIHFAAADGELFLDQLVEDMAKRLDCNLVTLDAQDISSLIVAADVDSMVKNEASALGYEVYGEIYKDQSTDHDSFQSAPSEEEDDLEEDLGAVPSPQGLPFMVGKPITIDLKAIFSSKPHRRTPGVRPSNVMPDVFGSSSSPKSGPLLFAPIIDAILSGVYANRTDEIRQIHQDNHQEAADTQSSNNQRDQTIVHLKDLRFVQDTNLGKQFLMQLYEQVERRRAGGETIMIVGTECSRDTRISYDHTRLTNLQSGDQEEISSTIVVTPVEATDKDDLLADRTKRLQIINARHLWQMLQSKNLTLDSLKPDFWRSNANHNMHAADLAYLEKGFWSFGYVQRIAAILASSESSNSQHPIAEAAAMIELSDNSKYTWAKQGRRDAFGDTKKTGSDRDDRIARIRAKANKHEKRLLSGVVESKKIATTFKDIHIPEDTVESLQTLTTLSLVRPDAFKYGVLASDRIPGLLLYGPPGTGKTLAAKAIARESGATMLEVSSADINDMYVGEGEKNVKALFSLARKLSPCIVFLDEADAMFSARSAHGRRVSHRELLNQFLKEWDGMSNDSGSAFIMVATNRPMDLDDAVLRRLPRRLLVDLPTENDRLEILKIHLRHEELAEDVNLSQIAAKTPFYSGSDLKNLAVSAALNAVREETARAKGNAGDSAPEYPSRRTLTAHDFEKALEEIGASISEDMASLRDIKKFDEQYGDRKGRKRKSPKWGFKTSAEADAVLDTVKVRS